MYMKYHYNTNKIIYTINEDPRPYTKLLIGILARAALDVIGRSFIDGHIQRDAKAWFESLDEEPFSFLWVCSYLNLNPARTYKKILDFNVDSVRTGKGGIGLSVYSTSGLEALAEDIKVLKW
jgi:hypothetical protein